MTKNHTTWGFSAAKAVFSTACAMVILLAGFAVARADSSAVAEERDTTAQQLSFGKLDHGTDRPVTFGRDPDAPTVAGCPIVGLVQDGSTSGNERAPNLRNRFGRSVYLIKATEMAAAGITSGTAFSGIGWSFQTAPGLSGSGPLVVYMQNTTDVTNTKSTTWATAITGMTTVHNATTTIPNVTGSFDIPFSGGSPFTYTGGGLYVAFDAQYPVGTLSTTTVVWCNSTGLLNGLLGAQGAAAPATLAASNFRPETRLTPAVAAIFDDLSVEYVISLGSLAQPLVGPQTVQAVIVNKGVNPLGSSTVSLNITGADTFSDTKPVSGLAACGGTATVSFAPFTPGAIGSDTVAVTVPADDVAGNNSRTRPLDETYNLYSYKHPGTTAAGGVGLTGATGAFLAKFTTTAAAKISEVTLEFPATSATTYRVAIYPSSGGLPGLVPLYLDAADRTVTVAGPVSITLPTPIAVGPGTFFAGLHQTNTTNAGLGFDNETPIRSGAFYLATPNPPTAWFDFAPGNNFKLNIGVTLIQCATTAECDDANPCTDDACTNQLCVHTNNDANPCTDGNACTSPDLCVSGTCVAGANPCEDNNPCTADVCDGQGGCTYPPANCDDANPCTDDFCTPGVGCGHANNSAVCSDGNPCTIGDVCGGGACLPGTGALPAPVQVCNNTTITIPGVGAATPYPSTILVTGQKPYLCSVTVNLNGITHTFPDDIDVLLARLSGNNALIMSDVGGGTDVTGVSLTLSDAAATSIPDAGPLVSGTFKPTNIGGTDVFPAPAPAPTGGSALSTFNGSNPNGTWNLWVDDEFSPDGGTMSGWCLNLVSACGTNADCDDANPCTDDACVAGSCVYTNNTVPCDDGSFCTANDTCTNGACVGGAPPSCDDGDPCTADFCNPATGLCEHGPMVCDDNNPCTDDTCVAGVGCTYTANDNNACSDGSLCTSPDACVNGVCVGSSPVVCNDGEQCTTDTCDPATGQCVYTNNTNACDDGNVCTTGDICGPRLAENFDADAAPDLPGTWTATLLAGDPGDPTWYADVVTPDTPPNTAFVEDPAHITDNVLDSPEFPIASASAKLTFKNRFALESTFDGAVLEISMGGGPFDDIVTAGGSFASGGYTGTISTAWSSPIAGRSAWTGNSTGYPAYITTIVNLPAAAAGQQVVLRWRFASDTSVSATGQDIDTIVLTDPGNTCNGTPLDCDDFNPCTNDSCDPQVGCVHTNNTDACEDGSLCTSNDACSGGSCQPGTPTVCNDGNPCTDEVCDPQSGACIPSANSAPCDDGNPCTAGDVCALGSCQPGSPITAPGETTGVMVAADKVTYFWPVPLYATGYDAVRGSIGALPVGPGGGDETCLGGLGSNSFMDASVTAPGDSLFYIVRAKNACGTGDYGTQSDLTPRVTTTCP